MRCSAKRVTKHKVTFSFVNGSASGTYTSSPPAGGAVSLRLGQARFSASPGDRFIAAPLLRSPQRGSQGWGRAARLTGQTGFAPNTETFSAVYNISVAAATGRTHYPGGLGGRSRIEFIVSPLPRRRHNESHFAAQSPERAFLAKPFFARAKNGVNSGRRSHKISVSEAKCNICRHKRAAALHLIRRLRRHLPLKGEG